LFLRPSEDSNLYFVEYKYWTYHLGELLTDFIYISSTNDLRKFILKWGIVGFVNLSNHVAKIYNMYFSSTEDSSVTQDKGAKTFDKTMHHFTKIEETEKHKEVNIDKKQISRDNFPARDPRRFCTVVVLF
jgi:hypothetical protein